MNPYGWPPAVPSLASVSHDGTLTGDGTPSVPLGVDAGYVPRRLSRTVNYTDLAGLANGVTYADFSFAALFPIGALFLAASMDSSGFVGFAAGTLLEMSVGIEGTDDAIATNEAVSVGASPASPMARGIAGGEYADVGGASPYLHFSSSIDLNDYTAGNVTVHLLYLEPVSA